MDVTITMTKITLLFLTIVSFVADLATAVCPYPVVPRSMYPMHCSDSLNTGSQCYTDCVPGYHTTETLNYTCLSSGVWSKPVGEPCVKMECRRPPRFNTNFREVSCTDGYKFGSKCSGDCAPGYDSSKIHVGTCKHRHDLTRPHLFRLSWYWSSQPTACKGKKCGKIHIPLNAAYNCSGMIRFPTFCSYSCNDGYELPADTETTVRCTEAGDFSAPVLDCTPMKCPAALTSKNTVFTCTDTVDFGSICTYDCTPGFVRVAGGHYESECVYATTPDGIKMAWTVTPTDCVVYIPPSCPALTIPPTTNPVYACTDCLKQGSTCTVECARGYSLPVGVTNVLKCRTNATWDKPVSPCTKRSCPPVPVPDNAQPTVCSDGNLFGSICTFTCQPGFYLPAWGTSKTACTYTVTEKSAKMRWDGLPAACLEDACAPFTAPTNGYMSGCTNSFNFQSKCTVVCKPGYQTATLNEGFYVLTCKGKASGWDKAVIACQPGLLAFQMGETIAQPVPVVQVTICPKPYVVANVQDAASCTDNYNAGSVCEFECLDGFAVPDNRTNFVTCQQTLTWDKVATPCVRKLCAALVVPANAEPPSCTNGLNYESVCAIRCLNGYTGSSAVTCLASGQWDAQPETCQKRVCDAPVPSQHSGEVSCTQNYEFGSVCSFNCHPGYQLAKGSLPDIECIAIHDSLVAKMTWSADVPHCEASRCSQPPSKNHAQMKICTDSFSYQSTCSFSCESGYDSDGSLDIQLSCGLINGQLAWIDQSPNVACKALPAVYPDCNPLLITSVYNVKPAACKAPYRTGAKCTYDCLTGYVRASNGSGTVTCMPTGNWDNLPAACQKLTCPALPQLPHSTVHCTAGNRFESTCTFTCKTGYQVATASAAMTTTCQENGQWSTTPLDCISNACPPPTLNQNQQEDTCSNDYVFMSTCSFKCRHGFVIPDGGHDRATCVSIMYAGNLTASVRWSESPTPCKRKLCSSPAMPLYGHLRDCTGFQYQSHCTVSCQTGYSLVDSAANQVQCTANGDDVQWTSAVPGCKVSECEAIVVPEFGVLQGCTDGNNYLSQCTLRCSEGYHYEMFDDINVLICTHGKYWNAKPLPCLKNKCRPPVVPSNAELVSCSDGDNFGSVCMYQCAFGYHEPPAWSDKVTCTAEQTWDFVNAACLPNLCSKPTLQQHMELGCCSDAYNYASQCDIKCTSGYTQTDRKMAAITCNADGTWTNENATCERGRCDHPKVPAHAKLSGCDAGTSYLSTCSFQCDVGHHVPCYGISRITCENNAQWDREATACVVNTCPAPALKGKYYESSCSDKYNAGSSCKFQCEFGHTWLEKDIPQTTITCEKDGRWSHDVPTCVPKQCSAPITPPNSRLVGCSHDFTFLSECEYQCLPGYHVTGVPVMICQASTFWTSAAFVCQLNTCPPIRIPAHATSANCTAGAQFSSECTVQCDPGFCIAEPNNELATCGTSSNWDQELSPCIEIDECESSPCQHGGRCVNLINKYECVCDFSKAGDNCGTNLCKCADCDGKDCAIPKEHCLEGDCILDAVLVAVAFTIIALSMLVMVIFRMKITPIQLFLDRCQQVISQKHQQLQTPEQLKMEG